MSNISFAVGTGRCGTQFISEVLKNERDFLSSHERDPLSDTFHRYFKWYGLPIDSKGFLVQKEIAIQQDLTKHKFSFEASAFLSLSILELHKYFDARFVFMVRSPEKVVNSYLKKGWYNQPFQFEDPSLPLSYQRSEKFHHFMGRMAPSGDELVEWNKSSRICKLIWYWTALNQRVLDQLDHLPRESFCVQKIEDLDFNAYQSLVRFLGAEPTLTERKYLRISAPNSISKKGEMMNWTEEDKQYLLTYSRTTAETLGFDVDHIAKGL